MSAEIKRGRNKLAVTVIFGHAVKHIYNSGLQTILLPEIKIGLGLSGTQLGALAFSRQVTSWVTSMVAGYLGDRFTNQASLMIGVSLFLVGLSYFAVGYASSYWIMFVAMLFVGIGPAMYHPPAIGALSRRFPDRRGFALSLHGTGGSVGEVLGPLVTAGVLTVLVWQDVLKLSLFPALITALAVWGMMRSVPGVVLGTASNSSYLVSLVTLIKKRAMMLMILVTVLRSMGQNAVMIFLPVYLREDLEYSAARVALYLSMGQVVGIGAQPLMGFLSDRVGRKMVLLPALLFLGLLYMALALVEPGPQLILTILAMGAFTYSLHSLFMATAIDIGGEELQSTMVSVIYSAGFLGTISSIFAGIIVDSFGSGGAFLYSGAVVLMSGAIFGLMKLPRTRTWV